eukprot:5272484-Amphidinium_carterae.1
MMMMIPASPHVEFSRSDWSISAFVLISLCQVLCLTVAAHRSRELAGIGHIHRPIKGKMKQGCRRQLVDGCTHIISVEQFLA